MAIVRGKQAYVYRVLTPQENEGPFFWARLNHQGETCGVTNLVLAAASDWDEMRILFGAIYDDPTQYRFVAPDGAIVVGKPNTLRRCMTATCFSPLITSDIIVEATPEEVARFSKSFR